MSTATPERGEKISSFRGPTSQELVKFRKSIEQGNYDTVSDTIWANPRYLVGSGDTPSILKESFRYNALHVAALSKNAKICKLILETISNPKFVQLLHGSKDDKRTAEEVSLILLDLYLNMPEKGRSETPLHLATKYGAVDVVEVLTSYKECQMTVNSEKLFPKDVRCSNGFGTCQWVANHSINNNPIVGYFSTDDLFSCGLVFRNNGKFNKSVATGTVLRSRYANHG